MLTSPITRLPGLVRAVLVASLLAAGLAAVPAAAATPHLSVADGNSSRPADLVAHGGYVWFSATTSASVEPSLFKSDGTPSGTTLVASGVEPENLTWIGDTLYFNGYDQGLANSQLFVSNGTTAGTKAITTVAGNGLFAADFVAFRGGVLFDGVDTTNGSEPWFSNGQVNGTSMLKNIAPGQYYSSPGGFTVVGNGKTAVFAASNDAHGAELWRTDGTTAGTQLVKDIDPGPADSVTFGSAGTFAFYKGRAYFPADDGVHGLELWTSDGTARGTHLVKNIAPGSSDMTDGLPTDDRSYSLGLVPFDGDLWFAANDSKHGNELWRTDGTAKGTTLAVDITPGPRGTQPTYLTVANGHLVFDALDAKHGQELWFTDGTKASTHLIRDISPGPMSSYPYAITPIPSGVIFVADTPANGDELWHSTIRAGHAGLVDDIIPGPDYSFIDNLTRAGSRAYFSADDNTHGNELWVTDGTAPGTHMVVDLYP